MRGTGIVVLLSWTGVLSMGLALVDAAMGASPRFTITDDSFITNGDKATLKVVTDHHTGAMFSVIVDHGGSVEDLHLPTASGHVKPVIWSHSRNATSVKENADWRGRMLIPYGNRIGGAKYEFNHTIYHLPVNDVAGLNNSIHGLLWNKSMTMLGSAINDNSAAVTLRYDFDGSDHGYPFALRVDITYVLTSNGKFSFNVEATNLDKSGWPLPFYNGWHPYFLCNASVSTVTLDPCADWLHVDVSTGPQYPPPRYSNMVPTTRTRPYDRFNGSMPIGGNVSNPTYFDDEVKATKLCSDEGLYTTKLYDPVTTDTLVMKTSSPYRFLQVWTGPMSTFGVNAVVLEPLSAMSDGYNNHEGLHIISPGQQFNAQVEVSLQ